MYDRKASIRPRTSAPAKEGEKQGAAASGKNPVNSPVQTRGEAPPPRSAVLSARPIRGDGGALKKRGKDLEPFPL